LKIFFTLFPSLKNDFINDKTFLDKSLYPDNFDDSFTKLENALTLRKEDFVQITDLNTKVTTLQSQITDLSQKNEDLIKQINDLSLKVDKNNEETIKLNKLISQLRHSISQRDQLVRDLVDNLLSDFLKTPAQLNQTEKQGIISKVNNNNLFYNVERTIADNIQYLKITPMSAEELSKMKDQYSEFTGTWQKVGPRLSSVYLGKKEKKSEIDDINSLFDQWNKQIDTEMWANVYRLFKDKNIILMPFSNGDQFAYSVNSFIETEMKNAGEGSKTGSAKMFDIFSDSVYFKLVRAQWIPVLIENNMMNAANKDTIESKIAAWKNIVYPAPTNWPVIIIALFIVALVVFFMARMKMKEKTKAVHQTVNM
jgi:hypothetical protein